MSVPLFAQYDLTGEWGARYHEDQAERIPGPELGDYLGLPITDAARLRADSWDASIATLPEWQCRPHPADYGTRGPADLRIWKDVDTQTQQVIAYHTHVQWQAQERTIWMDGRPHPSADDPHTWQGFSTGKWDGNQLTVTTTHLKEGYVRRNGVPRSDRATLVEHWIRHGDFLTLVSIINDPVYLTQPFIRTTNWVLAPQQAIDPYPCEVAEEVERPDGSVPHHLPGANKFLTEFPQKYGLPERATRGGAETMYPEYRMAMRGTVASTAAEPETQSSAQTEPQSAIHVQRVRGSIFMLSGAGGNITIDAGSEGVLLVDTGLAAMTDQVLAELAKISDKPVRYILDTHLDPDHTGGNEKIAKLGQTIAGGDVTNLTDDAREGAKVIAHQNVLNRMTASDGGRPPSPFATLPTDTYFGSKKDLYFNDEGIRIVHPKAAHTDGDSMVYFRRSDVISTGDIFTTTGYPVIDLAHGGSIQGELDALNQVLGMVITARNEEAGTYVIPGHGRLCDAADVAYYRDMVTIIRDRIFDMKKKGMTLDQVQAARPTRDYDPRWGATAGSWTTAMFVEAVYASLGEKGTH
ncbi:MAG: MBL fold metallo-hydrolase [Bryobacteraceae bacterium]|jgi:glyoxylase-like metal-dependent hydrolase (beta-lactamase superfamily II)